MSKGKHKPTDDEKRVIPVTDGQDEPDGADALGETPGQEVEPSAEQAGAEPTLESLQAERDNLLSRLQRVSADYVNYQKRVTRDAEQSRQYANAELAKALLGVLDDLERAIDHAKVDRDQADPLLAGTELVYRNALEVLSQFGVKLVSTEGTFDPAVHEAILRQPSDEAEPMSILHTAQKGYTMGDRTLRPAKVVVAVEPDPEQRSESAPGEDVQ